jgi:hypothetical protein
MQAVEQGRGRSERSYHRVHGIARFQRALVGAVVTVGLPLILALTANRDLRYSVIL